MKKGLSALLLASLLCASSGCQQNPKEVVNEYNIVPMPNQMTPQEGRFQLSNKVSIATAGCRQPDRPYPVDFRYLFTK
jgi:hexosaminidase